MYELYGTSRTRALRVLWLLAELDLAFVHHADGPRSNPVLALNPSGKVPVLVTDGAILTDSTAIMTFLTDRHGRFSQPPGSVGRARQDGITQMLLDEFDALLWTAARHSFILPAEHRLPAIKDSLRWEFGQNAARLAARLTGPFVLGDAMTLPDIILTHCLTWAIAARFDLTEPVLRDYLDRMRARPAYIRAAAM